MIRDEELVEIGTFFKPHGIKGEMSARLDYEIEPSDIRCIVVDTDGIFVPWFIESWRRKGRDGYLLKLDGIEDEKMASRFSNHEIYAIRAELPEIMDDVDSDGVYLHDLEGFSVEADGVNIGKITTIDDSTANILFHILNDEGQTVFVPFAEEWINEIDTAGKVIKMTLPEGILNLN